MHALISWLGQADLEGIAGESDRPGDPGPLTPSARHERYDEIHLLCNQPKAAIELLYSALESDSGAAIHLHSVQLASPIHFGDKYNFVNTTRLTLPIPKKLTMTNAREAKYAPYPQLEIFWPWPGYVKMFGGWIPVPSAARLFD